MRKNDTINESDILSRDEYKTQRKILREKMVLRKKNRRLDIGPYITIYFENRDTILHQINEMVYIENGGFSSYQAEYPFGMTKVRGNILTPIGTLLNDKAEKNFLIFRNILSQPLNLKFEAFFVDIEQRKILKKINFQTNYTNFIEIENDLIRPQVYLVTKNFVGIPIYLSIDKEHLSFEHTHPPHAYFFGNDAYKNVKILKEKVNEIIA